MGLPDNETLPRFLQEYSNLSLGSEASGVQDYKLQYGSLSLALESGSAAVVFAGGRAVGLFFKGEGHFEYVSRDSTEFPVMAFNLEKGTRLHFGRTEKGYRISDPFKTLLVLSIPKALQLPRNGGGADLTKDFGEHSRRFLRDTSIPASQTFALRELNAASSALVRVEMGGGPEDLVYVFDEALDRREYLYSLRRAQSSDKELKERLWPNILSEQLLGRNRRDPPDQAFQLIAVECELTASEGKDATVSVTETILPRREGLSALRFELYDRRYAVTSSGLLERRDVHLKSVTEESGSVLPFDHRNDSLLVGLGRVVPNGSPLRLKFELEGPILIRPKSLSYWQLGPGPWFPQPEMGGQSYTFRASVKVRKPFVAFAPGVTLARREEGDYNVLESNCDKPVQYATILAGKYESAEETREGLTIRVATYAGIDKSSVGKLMNTSFGIIGFYETFLGPFPFDEYTIVEINQYGFGLAPPGMMFITKELFNLPETNFKKLYLHGASERFAHEIAHQYWGHAFKLPSDEDAWLSEAFAEYCAALVFRQAKGDGDFRNIVAHWKRDAEQAAEASPIPLAGRLSVPLDESVAAEKRNALVYEKGACLLATLHKEMGEEKFLAFLKSVQTSLRWKFGTTRGVQTVLERVGQKDYGPFFETYYWGTGMPECRWP